ncbi:hypothetical protein VCHA53O466_50113 [Vibrio chagasii]|nr:hypothetical protein VCHA53O466_50113 [Vibrio chagasii]
MSNAILDAEGLLPARGHYQLVDLVGFLKDSASNYYLWEHCFMFGENPIVGIARINDLVGYDDQGGEAFIAPSGWKFFKRYQEGDLIVIHQDPLITAAMAALPRKVEKVEVEVQVERPIEDHPEYQDLKRQLRNMESQLQRVQEDNQRLIRENEDLQSIRRHSPPLRIMMPHTSIGERNSWQYSSRAERMAMKKK